MRGTVTLDDLCRPWAPGEAPRLDWPGMGFAPGLTPLARRWAIDGFVIIEAARLGELTPFDDELDAYAEAWLADNADRPTGWPCDTPYMHEPEVRRQCNKIAWVLAHLIGEPCGVHLNLSGWRSTTRNWHQDGYLNPDTTADHYAAVWFALDDIHPDAGPFQYVPGSHREFGVIRQDLMLEALGTDVTNTSWPRESERILTPLFEEAIAERGLEVREFVARRGDVLIWHPRLLHRGSRPRNPDLERRALIAHFSGIYHRPDMPAAVQHPGGGWFFPIEQDHGRCEA